MKAQVLTELCEVEADGETRMIPSLPFSKEPLKMQEVPDPVPGRGEVRIRVCACGVCHTELDEIEGRRAAKLPVIPGHEVVGRIDMVGEGVTKFSPGDRVGVSWIYSSCGGDDFSGSERENLCDEFMGTGCDADGGYGEYMVIGEEYAFPIPVVFSDIQAAPLFCAGAVGYRALKLTGMKRGDSLGLYGFGASAHIIIQLVRYCFPDSPVYVITRSAEHRRIAGELGASWSGVPGEELPGPVTRALDFTPVGETVPLALKNLQKGGKLVINAIRKRTPICLDYIEHLWYEKEIQSTANVTRKDVREFLALASEVPIIPMVREFSLEEANEALRLLKAGRIDGAAVLRIGG